MILFFDTETTGPPSFRRSPLVSAHDAMEDVVACAEVYFHLQSLAIESAAQEVAS